VNSIAAAQRLRYLETHMTPRTRRTRNLGLTCAAFTGVCLLLFALQPEDFWLSEKLAESELWAKDVLVSRSSKLAPDPRLVFVGIDQTTYADVIAPEEAAADPTLARLTNSFPWSRDVWAAVIGRLADAGAKAIVLDLVFASPGSGDDQLRAALDRYADRVVIGANFTRAERGEDEAKSIVYPSESVLSVKDGRPIWADDRVGFVNFFTYTNAARRDIDDIIRRATFRVTGESGLPPGATIESLASRALKKLGVPQAVPNDARPRLFRYVGKPGNGFQPISLYTIFLPNHWTNNFESGKFFSGKIVLIGPAANILHDDHPTPFRVRMLGPEIHLNAMSAALRGEFLGESSHRTNLALVAGLGALAFLLMIVVRSPARRLIVATLCIAAYAGACWFSVNHFNFVLIAITPLIALSSSTLAGFTYDFVLERREKNRTRRTLERYVSKDVVRDILDNPDTYLNSLGGVRKPVTILFSDVRGFTTMTEGADASKLVAQLNEYFNDMVRIVFTHQGRLDKFIGDAVMADWGSIVTAGVEQDAKQAVATALEMRKYLALLNINWKQRGMAELSFGIGINHGEVIFGNLGADEKRDVTVIGDAVNLASRLEGLTKEYKLDLLLGENMVPLVQSRFILRTVGSVQVKGKTIPVRIFTVLGDKEAGEQPPAWLSRYEEGIKLYRARKFAEAEEVFLECVRAAPADHLSKVYLDECRELLAHPPGLDWNTVVVMKSK
jgi:adenylate cyclase